MKTTTVSESMGVALRSCVGSLGSQDTARLRLQTCHELSLLKTAPCGCEQTHCELPTIMVNRGRTQNKLHSINTGMLPGRGGGRGSNQGTGPALFYTAYMLVHVMLGQPPGTYRCDFASCFFLVFFWRPLNMHSFKISSVTTNTEFIAFLKHKPSRQSPDWLSLSL